MKFGVFYEHQLPRPWTTTSEHDLLQQSLDQFQFADQLGYDYAWVVEHHFLEEYSHSSAPEVFLGAASQRTKNIRLGHGVIQLTTNQPQRVAEKVATLDLLSGGRVDLGMGEAAGPAELHPFGVRVRDKRDRWEEAVRAIIPMFTRDNWEFHGQYYDFPARNVIPKPLQKPHPPLWVACSNIRTIGDAGQWGMGALGFSFVSPEAARAWVHRYYNNLLHRPKRLGRLRDQSQHRHRQRLHVRADRRGGDRGGVRLDVLHLRAELLRAEGHRRARHRQSVARVPGLAADRQGEAGAAQRTDRLAGHHPPAAAPVRGGACRSGDPAQSGRPHQPPGDLRQPGAVRSRGDAGVPRSAAGTGCLEGRMCLPAASFWRNSRPSPTTSMRTRTRTSCASRPSS